MTFRQILRALRARFGIFVLVLLLTVGAAAGVSLMLPKTYKATVALLVDSKDEQSLGAQQGPNFSMPQERQSYMQTQMDIIGSRKVARKVVDDLKLASLESSRAAFERDTGGEGSIEDWLAETLLKRLKVEATQSNVIQATYTGDDRHATAQVTNAFAKAYMDTMVELRTAPTRETAAWFDEQLQALRNNLETAQAKLTDYLQKRGIAAPDDKLEADGGRLGALIDQALRAREQSSQISLREQQARQFLEQGGTADRLPDAIETQTVQRLKAELAAGEAKMQELSGQYGVNHPAYQRQQSQNQSLRERLDAEAKKVAAGIASTARATRQREASLASALAAERAKMIAQRGSRDEARVLRRNVESAERSYDLALQRATIAQVESRVRQTNVALLSPAVAPRIPSSPRLMLALLIAAVLGTILALAVVALLEMNNRRVRSREDLGGIVDVPMLGVINAWQPPKARLLGASGSTNRALPRPS